MTICVGTIVRTPFDKVAGLNEPDAAWPLTTGSVSTISRITFCGISIDTGVPSCIATETTMPSCRYLA